MLTKKMEAALNKQIELEAYASFLYLSMASWLDIQGMNGSAQFMHRQSVEERDHMLRIFHYISDVDGHPLTPSVKQVPLKFTSPQELFEMVYEHEKKVTASINKIVDLSYKENDYATLNFLQWYVAEQMEEEALMRTILDRIKLIGNGPQSLYYIDKEMEKINQAEASAAAAEADAEA